MESWKLPCMISKDGLMSSRSTAAVLVVVVVSCVCGACISVAELQREQPTTIRVGEPRHADGEGCAQQQPRRRDSPMWLTRNEATRWQRISAETRSTRFTTSSSYVLNCYQSAHFYRTVCGVSTIGVLMPKYGIGDRASMALRAWCRAIGPRR